MRVKRNTLVEAPRVSVLEHLEDSYPNHLQIITDGSVDQHRGVSVAAYVTDAQVS